MYLDKRSHDAYYDELENPRQVSEQFTSDGARMDIGSYYPYVM